ncbi:MAG TPA: efflux RND transporter periplasmic adaptor subunit [Candidatus Omnitrophota bacterium]|nr:efflux RND transporter periplasmic adaptor subunit [Candidatus Omnitrophota bacterium]HOX09475.1 efflux RND transporter periplasmic adaptor subunit [Candidatus Omnitrophota bacterium]HPN66659.1 efflux RND transporter periplasmic adaptor subunit [Candidatus Omnitrophota bacterium]
MFNKKWKIFLIVLVVIGAGAYFMLRPKQDAVQKEEAKEVKPAVGIVETYISTTGSVLPQNRLEIKPTVNGRIDKILVKEGDNVKTGQTLGWMSSTERAALLDAAKGKDEATLKYWEDAYKAIPLLAPIDGEVIVSTIQPGQTVTTADAIFVLSDRLIVRAQVDETDIGKIKLGQAAILSLDAYPDTKIRSTVGHIYYESETVNNVTIYKADMIPAEVPEYFRSGMNANVDFIDKRKENVLTLPLDAVRSDSEGSYVLLSQGSGSSPVRRAVTTGLSDDKNIEIISGVTAEDTVEIRSKKFVLPKNQSAGTNPFMPQPRRR